MPGNVRAMISKWHSNIMSVLKRDFIPLLVLLFLTIGFRLVLIMRAPYVYHFDSYMYLSKAISFASQGEISIDVGAPFVLSLGILIYIFGPIFGPIMLSRLLMLSMSLLVAYVVYLFGLRMSGKIFGFVAALVAIFEPFFLSYSIVPHNDVFVIALGLLALYLVASTNTPLKYALSLILFYTVIFTRPEFFAVLIVPFLLFYLLRFLKAVSVRTKIKFVSLSLPFFVPIVWIAIVYPNRTRFNIIEKFSLFLKPELLQSTLDSLFEFYDQALLNQIFFALVALGIGLALFGAIGRFFVLEKKGKPLNLRRKKDTHVRDVFLSDGALISFVLLLVFIMEILILTVYGYGYVVVGGALIIQKEFADRYLILSRLILSYPLAYILSTIIQKMLEKPSQPA